MKIVLFDEVTEQYHHLRALFPIAEVKDPDRIEQHPDVETDGALVAGEAYAVEGTVTVEAQTVDQQIAAIVKRLKLTDYQQMTLDEYMLTDHRKAAEQGQGRQVAKSNRTEAVRGIVVVVDNMSFDGDEVSQDRMTRAVTASESMGESTQWVLADNSVATVTADQLKRALKLAGVEQTRLWMA